MEKRQLGSTGMEVTVLGFGGAEIGYQGTDAREVQRLLSAALDAGLNVIDTAECYVDSEEKIGAAVGHRRKDFFLFSKCGHVNSNGKEDWRPESLLNSIGQSVKKLRTDYLDLIQLHSCSLKELQAGEVIDALETARSRGLARFIGYSGDGEAARYAIECGRFDTLQTSVSIADQQAITTTLPLARQKGIGVIAKRPIANAAWKHTSKPTNAYYVPYWERLQKLQYPFLTTPEVASIALRFTMAQPAVATAIVGTTQPERWQQNAALLDAGPLPPEQIKAIRERWNQTAKADWVGQN